MTTLLKELSDNRQIRLGIFEIASFPALDGATKEIEAELERSYNMFLQTAQEFYKLGENSNTVTELF